MLNLEINGELRIVPYTGVHYQIRFPLKQERYYRNL